VVTTNGNETVPPRPVPEADPGARTPAVTDDDRNRFGTLLDAAAERGLLSPTEYQARLGEVAEAGSVAELQRIVTELPAFGAPTTAGSGSGSAAGRSGATPATGGAGAARPAPDLDAILCAGRTPPVKRRDRGNQWLVLALVVAVLLVALVALGLVAAHLVHTHGAATTAAGAVRFSSLRL
jgi:hypothetical protein